MGLTDLFQQGLVDADGRVEAVNGTQTLSPLKISGLMCASALLTIFLDGNSRMTRFQHPATQPRRNGHILWGMNS